MDNDIQKLIQDISAMRENLNVEDLQIEADKLKLEIDSPDFWSKSDSAKLAKKYAHITEICNKWNGLLNEAQELLELSKMGDSSMDKEMDAECERIQDIVKTGVNDLIFSRPYADHAVYLSIYAGAGGVDAMDWASMLLRMYARWAQRHGYKVNVIEETSGAEAGIKSATIEILGENLYGILSSEHGVHRLVRLSPFNADNLRQTSFAKVEVVPKIDASEEVDINDKDLKIDVFRAGGHGGQSVNTTDSAVRITHLPTGIVVSIQNERSQLQNKETALSILKSKLISLKIAQNADKLAKIKGENQAAEWGNQIRSYVLHPYSMVKDLRSRWQSTNTEAFLDGAIDECMSSVLGIV